MDSQDQGATQSTTEQPEVKSEETKEPSQPVESDETVSKAEYKRLQAEYTKSRQELSEFKKSSELSEEDKNAIAFLKKNGFQTKDDLERLETARKQEATLSQIISANPDLQAQEGAIRDLAKSQ